MKVLLSGIVFFALISCSNIVTERDVLRDISANIRQNYNDSDMKAVSFEMEHISGNNYTGVLQTIEEGAVYYYDVDVVIEGGMFMWEIKDNGSSDENTFDSFYDINDTESLEYEEPKEPVSIDLKEYLRKTQFTLSGNGTVTFTFNSYSDDGSVFIGGNGSTLNGKCSVNSNLLYIEELRVTTGYFDATNNSGSSGVFFLLEDGSLKGSLNDRNGNKQELNILPKK